MPGIYDFAFPLGLVEVEEGEVNGQELSIASHSIARISFAKKPHVEQVSSRSVSNSHLNVSPGGLCLRGQVD